MTETESVLLHENKPVGAREDRQAEREDRKGVEVEIQTNGFKATEHQATKGGDP